MSNRHRVPYQTPPSSPYKSPPPRSPDISPPKGGPSKPSHPDFRSHKTSSSSGPRVSATKKGDQPKGPRGSRYAVNRPHASQHAEPTNTPSSSPRRDEPLNVQPLRSVVPTTMQPSRYKASRATASMKESSTKVATSMADPPRNTSTKRKGSDMSPPKTKKPSLSKPTSSDVAPVIRSVLVSKKKVTFKHVDLEELMVKHELEAVEVRFYAPDDDFSYDMISNYKYDEFHLLTTVGAFKAGLMLPLYKSGDSFYYDALSSCEGSTHNTHCLSVVQWSGNYLRTRKECYLRSKGETMMTCYVTNPA